MYGLSACILPITPKTLFVVFPVVLSSHSARCPSSHLAACPRFFPTSFSQPAPLRFAFLSRAPLHRHPLPHPPHPARGPTQHHPPARRARACLARSVTAFRFPAPPPATRHPRSGAPQQAGGQAGGRRGGDRDPRRQREILGGCDRTGPLRGRSAAGKCTGQEARAGCRRRRARRSAGVCGSRWVLGGSWRRGQIAPRSSGQGR